MLSSTRGALNRMAAANRLTEMVLPTVVWWVSGGVFLFAIYY